MVINSGRITVFSGFIASMKEGVEAKLVQRGPVRARNFNGDERGIDQVFTTDWGFPLVHR
jgi:hypothetical protein